MPHDFFLIVGGLVAVFLTLAGSMAWGSYQTDQSDQRPRH
jgi:hypothetical protein